MLPSFFQMLLCGEPPSYLKSPLGTCLERMRLKITKNRPRVQHAGITCCMLYVWAFAQKSGEKKEIPGIEKLLTKTFPMSSSKLLSKKVKLTLTMERRLV